MCNLPLKLEAVVKQIPIKSSVAESTEQIKGSLRNKGFTLFCDIDHQANAKSVGLDMPASRLLIFGNPVAGTKLMQKDITASFDLPLRIAILEKENQNVLIHQTTEDFTTSYQLENHPVLEKIEALFNTLVTEIN